MSEASIKTIVEAVLMAAGKPLPLEQIDAVFGELGEKPERDQLSDAILPLQDDYAERGIELVEVAAVTMYRSDRTWSDRGKTATYSRALLETLRRYHHPR